MSHLIVTHFVCPRCGVDLSRKHLLSLDRTLPCPNCGDPIIRSTHSIATGWTNRLALPVSVTLAVVFWGMLVYRSNQARPFSGRSWETVIGDIGVSGLVAVVGGGVLGFGLAAIMGVIAGFVFWVRWYDVDKRDFDERGSPGSFANNALMGSLFLAATAIAVPRITAGGVKKAGTVMDQAVPIALTLAALFVICLTWLAWKRDRRFKTAIIVLILALFALVRFGKYTWDAFLATPS